MTVLRSRASKGSELSHAELDANFVRDVDIKTTTYAALVSDNRTTLECSHATTAFTVTLGDAVTMAAAETGDYEVTVANIGAAAVTVARAGSDTIDGVATSIVLQQYDSVTLKVNAATNGYNSIAKGLGYLTSDVVGLDDTQTLTNKTLTSPALNNPTLTLTQSASPTPTAEGVIEWDTDDNTLKVGDGSTTQTFTPDSGAGQIVQIVNVQDGAVATGTVTIPSDDTIPQNTEGDEYMTLAVTPTNTNNKLKIDVVITMGNSATAPSHMMAALFQDSTAGAVAAMWQGRDPNTNRLSTINFTHYMTAGTTSATTFKVRGGALNAGTTTFNGVGGTRYFGGVMASSITITEIQV